MKVKSTRLGTLEVADDQMISFAQGLPGFPEEREFAVIWQDPESPFAFLQSLADPHLTFVLADPFVFFSDYHFELDDNIAAQLGLSAQTPPQVLLIATIKESFAESTVNLMAPVVINLSARVGRQVILDHPEYTVRHKLFPGGMIPAGDEGRARHVGSHP
ncbi:MAG: flagellar assembly protein FliW [Peptococcaceae bacterium]|nr:flagellar assembly protein FliW [Peptococcaceae bacterium]